MALISGWSKHGKSVLALSGTRRVYKNSSLLLSDCSDAEKYTATLLSPFSNCCPDRTICSFSKIYSLFIPLTSSESIWLAAALKSSITGMFFSILKLISEQPLTVSLLDDGIEKWRPYLISSRFSFLKSARALLTPASAKYWDKLELLQQLARADTVNRNMNRNFFMIGFKITPATKV